MTVVGEATIKVRPDVSTFGSELTRDANGKLRNARGQFVKAGHEIGGSIADGTASGFKQKSGGVVSSVSSIAKKAAAVFVAGFAVTKGIDFFQGAFAQGDEARRIAAQTGAVIKSTGGIAGVTAGQIDKLSTALSLQTGIDDDLIAKGSNLLLTFTNVRNEAGKGNDVFNQATGILADMGAALGTDVTGSAIQVGKALNDPIKGITALTRVGVTFSAEQKKQIEQFQKQGNLAGAQKVILAELTKEFGGSAAAQASGLDRLKVAWGNLQEQVGQSLNPAVEGLVPALQGIIAGLGPALGTLTTSIGGALGGLAPILSSLLPVVGTIAGKLGGVLSSVFEALGPVIDSLAPPLTDIIGLLGSGLAQTIRAVAPAIQGLAAALAPILKLASLGLGRLLVAVMPALVRFGEVIAEVFAKVGPILVEIGQHVLAQLQPQLPALTDALVEIATAFGDLVLALVPLLIPLGRLSTLILTKIQAPVLILLAKSVAIFASALAILVKPIAAILGSGLNTVVGWLESFIGLFTKANLSAVADQFVAGLGVIGDAITGLVSSVGAGLGSIVQFFRDLPGRIVAGIVALPGLLVTGITTALTAMGNAIVAGLTTAIAQFISFPFRVIDAVLTLVPMLIGFLGRLFPQVVAAELRGLGLMVSFFLALPGRVIGAVTSLGPRLVGAVAGALSSASGAAGRGVGAIVSEIGKLPARILGLAGSILSAGSTIGGKIIAGIKSGITGAAGVVGDIASAIGGKLRELLHGLVQKINDAIPDKLGKGPFSIGLPHDPIPNPFAFGGVTTQGRIDGDGSRRLEVVVPLERGRRRAADVAASSGLLDLIGPGAGASSFTLEVPVSVSFVGVVPTHEQAAMVGRTVGDAVAERAIRKRKVLADARTTAARS